MNGQPKKVCLKCGDEKILDDFYRNKNTRDGRESRCKTCQELRSKTYRARPGQRELRTKQHREWIQAHPEWESTRAKSVKSARPGYYLLKLARQRARQAGVVCTLQENDIQIPQMCPLLGIELVMGTGKVGPASPSVDRIDATMGYEPGNVWVISHRANTIKNNATLEELETIARNLRAKIHGPTISSQRSITIAA